jgi:hypothetical protein
MGKGVGSALELQLKQRQQQTLPLVRERLYPCLRNRLQSSPPRRCSHLCFHPSDLMMNWTKHWDAHEVYLQLEEIKIPGSEPDHPSISDPDHSICLQSQRTWP